MTMTSDSCMAKDAEIVVARVANGYMVHRRPHRDAFFVADEALVFPSLAALVAFMGDHFTHRAHAVPMDSIPLEAVGLGAIGQTREGIAPAQYKTGDYGAATIEG